jgi:hypothetical protein
MTPQEENTLASFASRLTQPIELRLYLSDDPAGKKLQDFGQRLGRIAPQIKTVEADDETGRLPAILIGERLRYCGVPSGNELEPFLEALSYLDTDTRPSQPSFPEELKSLHAPVDLLVFVTPSCSFCPAVVRLLLPLAFASAPIYLTVIDAGLFPEFAAANKIKSVPTSMLDDHLRWTGMVDMGELARAAVNRDPATLGSETLGRILQAEDGAYELAGMMLRCQTVFPAFADLLTDERFTVRLAAMVAVEDLLDRDGDLAQQMVAPIIERYPRLSDAVKGDILYLFGEFKSKEALPLLQAATSDPNAEIREAAAEALEKIDSSR